MYVKAGVVFVENAIKPSSKRRSFRKSILIPIYVDPNDDDG